MDSANPAENLAGRTIGDTWLVVERISLSETGSTGGFFSIPYKVKNVKSGQVAFIKVLDVVKALSRYGEHGVGVAETMSRLGSAHIFEVALMDACREKKLNRIVNALDSGEFPLEITPIGKIGFPYLIFELGDGDTYAIIQAFTKLDHAWWFHTLHQVAVGLKQLHSIDIAHQDIKASNVVFFGQENAKLADLGRAVRRGVHSLNDERLVAGDGRHAPPECYYNYTTPDWAERHFSTDLYLLGSLAFVAFARVSMTYAIFARVPPEFLPQNSQGRPYNDVIPALTNGLAKVLAEIRGEVPEPLRDLFFATLQQLCHPDPCKRGHPHNHQMAHGQRFSTERYISAFRQLELITRLQVGG